MKKSWILITVLIQMSLLTQSFGADQNSNASESTQALTKALLELESDIRRDTQELNTFRGQVEKERIPLANELETLRDRVAEQREQVQRARDLRAQGATEQEVLVARATQFEGTAQYLRDLFSEYARASDARLQTAREEKLMTALDEVRRQLDVDDGNFSQDLSTLLNLSIEWNTTRIGGISFEGPAIDPNGIEHVGTFVSFGPVSYFSADDKGPTGLVILQPGSDQPAVYSNLRDKDLQAIKQLVKGERSSVPLDVMGGKAIQLNEAKAGVIEHLSKGGMTIIPLLLVALAAIALSVWKFIELKKMEFSHSAKVDAVLTALQQNQVEDAKRHAEGINRPLRLLVTDLIEYRDAPREHLEEILQEHVLASLPFVERNLSTLAVLGGVAPLLGLLGTVTGMIHTFQLVTLFGSGDAKLLSGGISEALVTTEIGLIIAIPTLLLHALLSRRARNIVGSLDAMSTSLVNTLKLRKETV